jgi:hypothetical protein
MRKVLSKPKKKQPVIKWKRLKKLLGVCALGIFAFAGLLAGGFAHPLGVDLAAAFLGGSSSSTTSAGCFRKNGYIGPGNLS